MTVLLELIDEVSSIKQDLKTAINAKGGSLDNDTPFAEYVDAIEDMPTADAVLEKTLSGDFTSSVQNLGSYALSEQEGLTSVSLPNCTIMGERCIQNCQNITSVSMPLYEGWTLWITDEGDAEIYQGGGQYCFEWCYNLETANLSALKIIPSDFFGDCKALSTLNASSLYGVCHNSFRDYDEWEPEYHRVTRYEIMKNLGLDFMNYQALIGEFDDIIRDYVSDADNNITNSLSFPNLKFCNRLFRYNDPDPEDPSNTDILSNITSVSVPDLRKVESWSDLRWNVTTLDLPAIRTIREHAFSDMDSLTTINIGNKVRDISTEAFSNCQNVTTVNIDIDQNTQDQDIIDNVINRAPWGLDQSVTINWAVQ